MRLLAAVAVALILPACGQVQPPAEPVSSGPAPAHVVEEPEVVAEASASDSKQHLWFEPASLRACDPPQRVTVHWDASGLPGSGSIEVKPVVAVGKPQLVFAVVGRKAGSKETGPWMRGGAEFVLVSRTDGSVLARSKLEAVPCS